MPEVAPLTRSRAEEIVRLYIRAWEEQDPALLDHVFAPDARYDERSYDADGRFAGLDAIRSYWFARVVDGQRDIRVRLLNLFCDGRTIVAEWKARFWDIAAGRRKEIHEVAIMEVGDEGKVVALREFWQSRALE